MTETLFKFHRGEESSVYDFFGAHAKEQEGKKGYLFRVWAPHAREVSVVGDFNNWDPAKNKMIRLEDGECFELFVPGLKEYDLYKYCITARDGKLLFKADPVGFHTETPPKTSSKLYPLGGYRWRDGDYCKEREKKDIYSSPMNIYEVSLLSWKRHEDEGY